MTDAHQKDLDRLTAMFRDAEQAASVGWLDELYMRLVEGDRYLKQVVDHTLPVETGTVEPPSGAEEMFWGVIPAVFAYPPKEIPPILREAMERFAKIQVDGHSIIPPTTIIPEARWSEFLERAEKDGVVDGNGDIWGTKKYQQLDWRWIQALLDSYLTPRDDKLYKKEGQVIQIGDKVKIGLVGDWGTGTAPATKVIAAAAGKHPEYLVHLGDVYYSGRDSNWWNRLDHTAEEKNKFVELWRKNAKGITSFALNSNHEMYSKARGYFEDALTAEPFLTQKGASHFLLHNADWQIFGLDTAWGAKPYLYMEGALNDNQVAFLRKYADPKKKIILLSHHTGLDTSGSQVQDKLWTQIETALKRQPDYWYWGHIHNGIVYNGVGRQPAARNHTKCRCVGHGAIPYGLAWALEKYRGDGKPIAHFSTKDCGSSGNELMNGFATLELNGAAITERFFTEDGSCVWSSNPAKAVPRESAADPGE